MFEFGFVAVAFFWLVPCLICPSSRVGFALKCLFPVAPIYHGKLRNFIRRCSPWWLFFPTRPAALAYRSSFDATESVRS